MKKTYLYAAVAHSTSVALAAEMLPMLLSILGNGLKEACVRDRFIRRSLTAYRGILTHEETGVIRVPSVDAPRGCLGDRGA